MYLRNLAVMAFIFILLGSFNLYSGITGFYLLDFEKNSCNNDLDCSSSEVCCYFSNENAGVCDLKENCKVIEEKTNDMTASTIFDQDNTEKTINFINYNLILIGLVLLVCAVLISAFLIDKEPKKPRKKI